jgi:adenylate cyclase
MLTGNVGSRPLEGVTKEYGASIIISEATWEPIKDRLATRELDIIRVKGKDQPTRIFEVLRNWDTVARILRSL